MFYLCARPRIFTSFRMYLRARECSLESQIFSCLVERSHDRRLKYGLEAHITIEGQHFPDHFHL
jgi:hypothetical protein